jgi:tRNA(Ile)-lysidine synthase TilS/MesJ
LTAIDADWRDARLCVGYSGGLDSTVLLHAAAALRR